MEKALPLSTWAWLRDCRAQFETLNVSTSNDGDRSAGWLSRTGGIIVMATAGTVINTHNIAGDAGIALMGEGAQVAYVSLPIPADAVSFGERVTLIHSVHSTLGPLHLATLNHSRIERWDHRTSRYVAEHYGITCPDQHGDIRRQMLLLTSRMQEGERMQLMGAHSGLRLAATG